MVTVAILAQGKYVVHADKAGLLSSRAEVGEEEKRGGVRSVFLAKGPTHVGQKPHARVFFLTPVEHRCVVLGGRFFVKRRKKASCEQLQQVASL